MPFPVPLVIVVLALSACSTPLPQQAPAQASLVDAERAFAQHALEHGVRDAFLRHFAPGGLMFVPAPARVEDVFARAPADPMATLLEWTPVASGVARSGDFGFTTGPARLARRDGSLPPRHSTFFSVWKRQEGGPWRVVIDAGVGTPGEVAPGRLLPSPHVRAAAAGTTGTVGALLDDERAGPWSRDAFLARLAPDALLQRHEAWPVQGRDAIRAAWPEGDEALVPAGGDMARSGDLAYTYGALTTARGAGHYLHLWTRDASGGAWRIAAALRLP
jgi:ketosteroid isomerase-like protein